MRRAPFVAVLVGCLAGGAALVACVDVPDSVRAQFAGPSTTDRSNYRPGRHGSAPPNVNEDPSLPAVAVASPAAAEATPSAADASTTTTTTAGVVPNEKAATTDGGTP